MARIELMDALRSAQVDAGVAPTQPKFARCERKDARLRPDQGTFLAELAEALMARRRVKSERITENTLIRIAIDLLVVHAAELSGSTEDELRNSVTSASTSIHTTR